MLTATGGNLTHNAPLIKGKWLLFRLFHSKGLGNNHNWSLIKIKGKVEVSLLKEKVKSTSVSSRHSEDVSLGLFPNSEGYGLN